METTVGALDLQEAVNQYLHRIRQIDTILEQPVNTLLSAPTSVRVANGAHQKLFPTWLIDDEPPPAGFDKETQSLCCLTVQRLRRVRRRLRWLDADLQRERLHGLAQELVQSFVPVWAGRSETEHEQSFQRCLIALRSETFGGLNPLTASQLFRVLMQEGEGHAHRGIGFMAFFAMIWPLYRKYPDQLNIGVRIEPSEPTAYVTAKCLVPIIELREICTRRAKLLSEIGESVALLRKYALDEYPTPYQRWQFNAELEELRTHLFFMRDIAISRVAFDMAEKKIGIVCDSLSLTSPLQEALESVLAILEEAIGTVSETSSMILEEGSQVLARLRRDLLAPPPHRAIARLTALPYGLLLNPAYRDGDPRKRKYIADLANAARRALELCDSALTDLEMASGLAAMLAPGAALLVRSAAVELAFTALADSNRDVAEGFDEPIRHAARWCKTIVDREIAYASAHNITDFDPAELVSGMAVAVRYDLMSTPIQVRDAVKRALEAVWSDGSWRLGRPFFTSGVMGTWPPTADVLWTLASAIEKQPSVDDADAALFSYVDWLERTRRTVRREGGEPASGWSADRVRQPSRVHVPTTALNIHVLLEIRNLVEHRLWELCQKRFTVPRDGKRLDKVFPVDLNRAHGARLHTFLSGMARSARGFHKGGTYSLVLHGPPGSSKTVLSEALSREMWRESQRWGLREPRLIRITPADFTRLGEDRIDSEARLIFDLLSHVRSTTILFDEIDDLLLRREGTGGRRFMDLVIPAMLNRLQDLRSACPHQEICFVFGTNFVENIEPALMRKGRIDRRVAVVYPDWHTRLATIGKHLDAVARELETGIGDDRPDWERFRRWIRKWTWRLAQRTAGWPWLVLDSFCERLAREIEQRRPELIQAAARPDRKALSAFRAATADKLAQEKASLAEPAYAGRLLRRFDSPELRTEYALNLLARGTGVESAKDVVDRGHAEVQRFAEARLDPAERSRQEQVWLNEIAGPLHEEVERQFGLVARSPVDYPRSSKAMLNSLREEWLPKAVAEPADAALV